MAPCSGVRLLLAVFFAVSKGIWVDEYNTFWDSPGIGQWESMPLGNGNLAANVWFMPTANNKGYDLWLALTISSSYDITSEWLKTIQLQLQFDPPISNTSGTFQQNLYISNATMTIITSMYNITLNIDLNNDTLYIYSLSNDKDNNYTLISSIVSWRTTPNFNAASATSDRFCNTPNYVPVLNDIIQTEGCSNANNELLFYHRNYYSNYSNFSSQFMYHLNQQLLSQYFGAKDDPYLNLTFGGLLSIHSDSDKNIMKTDNSIKIIDTQSSFLKFSFLTQQTSTLQEYIKQLCTYSDMHQNEWQHTMKSYQNAMQLHNSWWDNFWNRSWIMISSPYKNETNDTFRISQLYNRQRFLDALDGRSKMGLPIKFNGQSFWIDTQNGKPDAKDWGAAFWWQNTRQPYYNTLVAGDLDLNQNFYSMYHKQLNLIQKRNNAYFNISGGYFSETAQFNGLYSEAEYGWKCGHNFSDAINTYIKYHWVGGTELVNMLLNDYMYYQNDTIINYYTIPIANVVITHYMEFYHLNSSTNKLYMYPAQSLETWQCPNYPVNYTNCVVNPTEQIAGLLTITKRLLALPAKFGTNDDRQLWQTAMESTPDIPVKNGIIWPGEHIPPKHTNSENTELYTVHPFKMYSFLSNASDLDLAIKTYQKRRFPCNINWCQDILDASILGLTNDAKNMLVQRAKNGKGPCPWKWWGFYCKQSGANDVPNHNHIEWMRSTVHYMLIGINDNDYINDNKIYLFPSWPCEWSVRYKLHAIMNTTIYLEYDGKGNITQLTVEPKERMSDIVYVNCVEAAL